MECYMYSRGRGYCRLKGRGGGTAAGVRHAVRSIIISYYVEPTGCGMVTRRGHLHADRRIARAAAIVVAAVSRPAVVAGTGRARIIV